MAIMGYTVIEGQIHDSCPSADWSKETYLLISLMFLIFILYIHRERERERESSFSD